MQVCEREKVSFKISPKFQALLCGEIEVSMQIFFLIQLSQKRINVHSDLLSLKSHVLFIFKPKQKKASKCKSFKKNISLALAK